MPATQIELCHGDEALHGVLNLWDWQHRLGVRHEAVSAVSIAVSRGRVGTRGRGESHFVMRSSMDRGSRINVGSVTRLRSAPGRSCAMI